MACSVAFNNKNLEISFFVFKPTIVIIDDLVHGLKQFSLTTESLGCVQSSIFRSIHGNMVTSFSLSLSLWFPNFNSILLIYLFKTNCLNSKVCIYVPFVWNFAEYSLWNIFLPLWINASYWLRSCKTIIERLYTKVIIYCHLYFPCGFRFSTHKFIFIKSLVCLQVLSFSKWQLQMLLLYGSTCLDSVLGESKVTLKT